MRISDWSSDVCSSDLCAEVVHAHPRGCHNATTKAGEPGVAMVVGGTGLAGQVIAAEHHRGVAGTDRKSVVSGKSVSVRVDLGGRRILKKQTTCNDHH